MPMVGVSHCPSCQAVVNVKWTTCPACHGVINGVQAAPFAVGDSIVYRVPGDSPEGPFEVIETSQSRGQWWALVAKEGSHAWIHECLMVKEEQR
jgi:hypothetical protein